MDIRKFILLPLAVMAVFAVSCKDDDDDTKAYLDGSLSTGSFPVFAKVGQTVTFSPSGVSHPDGLTLGFSYRVYELMTASDTVRRAGSSSPYTGVKGETDFSYTFPDTLGTFQVYMSVYPEDSKNYYASSASVYITTVDDERSIPQINIASGTEVFTDPRDGEKYPVVTTGGKKWLGANLRYVSPKGGEAIYGTPKNASTSELSSGNAYYNCEAVRRLFGGFYTWEDAVKACPEGWELPSNADWAAVAKQINPEMTASSYENLPGVAGGMMVDAYFNGDKMWEFWPAVKITNKTGLSALPVGYYHALTEEDFKGMLEYACFWTSESNPTDNSMGYYRYIYVQENDLKISAADKKSVAMSVRCVKK